MTDNSEKAEQADRSELSRSALTGSAVETWTDQIGKAKYICFRNKRGEMFYFLQSTLMRGKPRPSWNTAEELPRTANMLTLENASHMANMTTGALSMAIFDGRLKAIKKTWRYGNCHREGRYVDISDLERFLAKRAIKKYKRADIEWDVDPLEVVRP